MANLTYLRSSQSKAAEALVTPSSEDSAYPLANILTLPVSKPFRTEEGEIGAQTIDLDFALPVTANIVGLVNHNLTDAVAINLYGGNTAQPDGSQFDQIISWQERTAWSIFDADETWRHWRLRIHDPSNAWGFIQIGFLAFGLKTQLDVGFLAGWRDTNQIINRVTQTETGPPLVGNLLSERHVVELEFDSISNAERDTLTGQLEAIKRERDAMLMVPDPDRTKGRFGRVIEDYTVTQIAHGFAALAPLIFQEDAVGRILPDPLPSYQDGDEV